MTQESIANSLHKDAIDLADKWSATYGKTNVDSRLMAEDLFRFITTLINRIEGYEQEVADLRETVNEQDLYIESLKLERDDLIDEMEPLALSVSKQSTELETADRCLSLIEDIVKFR